MSYIFVPYDSVQSLIAQFQRMDPSNFAVPKSDANFVLIAPKLYCGCYGGLLLNSIVQEFYANLCFHDYIADNFCLVWWHTSYPKCVGDQDALAVDGRVAVTPYIYDQLFISNIRKPSTAKSSYYGDKAWIMNSRS